MTIPITHRTPSNHASNLKNILFSPPTTLTKLSSNQILTSNPSPLQIPIICPTELNKWTSWINGYRVIFLELFSFFLVDLWYLQWWWILFLRRMILSLIKPPKQIMIQSLESKVLQTEFWVAIFCPWTPLILLLQIIFKMWEGLFREEKVFVEVSIMIVMMLSEQLSLATFVDVR